jgi:hypothetical protein
VTVEDRARQLVYPPTPPCIVEPLRPGKDVQTESSHLHIGACVPHRQQIWGDLTLHLLIQKHQFPDSKSLAGGVGIGVWAGGWRILP